MGVIGESLDHSLSPKLHNFAIQKLGISAQYIPIEIKGESLSKALEVFWEIGALGFNITYPHKRQIATLVGTDLGSVNTLRRGPEGWVADSTDAPGLIAAVEHLETSFTGFKRIVVLGSGGVVESILKYVSTHFDSLPEVHVLRRGHAEPEFGRLQVRYSDFNPIKFASLVHGAAGETIVLQATSAPLNGDRLEAFAPAIRNFSGVLIDLVYGTPSALVDAARQKGIPHQDGLPMLIEQARISQKLWWEKSVDYQLLFDFLTA